MVHVKVKITPRHAYVGTQGRRWYSYNPFATSALEGGEWSVSHCGRFTPGEILGGPRCRSERSRKIAPGVCTCT